MGNAVLAAKRDHFLNAGDGQSRLRGPWFVVETGVQNPAVVSRLMPAHFCFFFQTVICADGSLRPSLKAVARPTIPPPMMVMRGQVMTFS